MLFYGLVCLIAAAPIHYGANRPISWSLLAVFVGLLLTGWSYHTAVNKHAMLVSPKKIRPLMGAYLLVCVWIILQCLNIGLAHPLWQMTADTFHTHTFSSISIAPYQTLTGLMRLLTYGTVFWLSLQYCRHEANVRTLFHAVIIASTVYALYGFYVYSAGIPKPYPDSVTGTFINRNSYATYAGMCAILTLAMLIKTATSGLSHLPHKQKILTMITNLSTNGYKYLIPLIIGIAAIIMTHSRAGLVSFLFGTIVFFILCSHSRKRLFILAITLLAIGWGIIAGGEQTIERFADMPGAIGSRSTIYKVTWNAIKDMPYTGSGYNTFEHIFGLYKDKTISPAVLRRIDHAHNTYLENMLELGIPAFSLLLFCFLYMAAVCFKGVLMRHHNQIYPAVGVAVTVLVGFHSLFDFSLEMPAVAIVYAGVMGACCAQSWSTHTEHEEKI